MTTTMGRRRRRNWAGCQPLSLTAPSPHLYCGMPGGRVSPDIYNYICIYADHDGPPPPLLQLGEASKAIVDGTEPPPVLWHVRRQYKPWTRLGVVFV